MGSLKHLELEAQEAQDNPYDVIEKADCLFLVFDATRRSGATLDDLLDAADRKLAINKARQWKRNVPLGQPIEHVPATSPDAEMERSRLNQRVKIACCAVAGIFVLAGLAFGQFGVKGVVVGWLFGVLMQSVLVGGK
jgi:hypothetical protein